MNFRLDTIHDEEGRSISCVMLFFCALAVAALAAAESLPTLSKLLLQIPRVVAVVLWTLMLLPLMTPVAVPDVALVETLSPLLKRLPGVLLICRRNRRR